MVFYLPILFVYLSSIAPTRKYSQFVASMLMILLVILICGTRYYSDIDYEPYIDLFNETPSLEKIRFDDIIRLYGEPGYLFLSSLVKYFGLDFVSITLLFSLVSISLKILVSSKLVKNYTFLTSLYLCLHYVTVEFIELRWALASSIIILSIYFFMQSRYKLTFMLIMAATFFHYFSLIFLAIFVLRLSFLNTKLLCVVFLSSFILAIILKISNFSFSYVVDSEFYIIRRLFRYINDPESSVGIFSFLRIALYFSFFIIFNVLYNVRCGVENKLADIFIFLLSCSLLLSFVPLLYFRFMVVADFFALAFMIACLYKLKYLYRGPAILFISLLFCTWNFIDVRNYSAAGYIFEYRSWLKFI